ncbi:MAG: tryptophan synthase subunit alpha [Actinomycetota bacterium]|nr:MAG: tryptophan synthase subunit alpha [Actinomycetota bacterium]
MPYRGHHPGHRERPRAGRRDAAGPRAGAGRPDPGEPVRPGRQGCRDGRSVVRPDRRHRGSRVTGLAAVFAAARAEGRAALIGYLPAGFPSYDGAVRVVTAMVAAGVDIVEIGLPYSDPLMDGPVIQAAAEQALRNGTTTSDVLATVQAVASTGAPTLVMSYWNPVERYGVEEFADGLAAAGGTGVITPDLTPEEAGPWIAATDRAGIDRIFLAAPSSTDTRLSVVAQVSTGFVYAASTMGVTGARDAVSDAAPRLVGRLREVTDRPVAVGLGVSTGAQAAAVAQFADGVIVGSAFVRRVAAAATLAEAVAGVSALAAQLADGVRAAAMR